MFGVDDVDRAMAKAKLVAARQDTAQAVGDQNLVSSLVKDNHTGIARWAEWRN